MSVSRVKFLTRLHGNTNHFHLLTSIIVLVGLLSAFAFATRLNLSEVSALNRWSKASQSAKSGLIEGLPGVTGPGAISARSISASSVALQGCTVNCDATVPANGQANTPVQFNSTASQSGCVTQPVFEWNFGDGTPNSNQQNPTHTYLTPGAFNWTLTTSVGAGQLMIDTVAGGLGDGNPSIQAPLGKPTAIARDPQGRGIYVADIINGIQFIRFINTTSTPVTIAGLNVAPGSLRTIAGGGIDLGENVPAAQTDIGIVTGMGVKGAGDVLYFTNKADNQVRGINVTGAPVTIGIAQIGPGRVGTLATNIGISASSDLSGLAVHPVTGVVYVADASPGQSKVYGLITTPTEVSKVVVAGNGQPTSPAEPFISGPATTIPLLFPRSLGIEPTQNQLVITDTGHLRVIFVDPGSNAQLFTQLQQEQGPEPFINGLGFQGTGAYIANSSEETIRLLTSPTSSTVVAGTANTLCDYTVSNCGDGGPAINAGFDTLGRTTDPPVVGLAGDANGLFVLDQGTVSRGRVRYLNLSGGSVTIAGVTIPAGAVNTIAGNGLNSPFDGGLATGATFNTPVGVAADANGNLWISDTLNQKLRFVNRGLNPVTIFPNTTSTQTVGPGVIVTVNKDVGLGPGNGGQVGNALFDSPQGIFVTSNGIYVADSKGGPTIPPAPGGVRTSLIRFINTTGGSVTLFTGSSSPISVQPGQIVTVGGGGNPAGIGDGQFATAAKFLGASDVAVTSDGTIYVADVGQKAVRKIDGNSGTVSSVGPSAQYTGLALDSGGLLYIANFDGGAVLRENAPGSGTFQSFALSRPRDVAVAADGSMYVTVAPPASAPGNNQIVQLSPSGAPTVVAGGAQGFSGDGGVATNSQINISTSDLIVGSGPANQFPTTVGIAVAPNGDVLFTDSNNNRIRRLSPLQVLCVKTGTITIGGNNPVPTLSSLSPSSAVQTSGGFTLTVVGNGFVPGAIVKWNGQDRTTSYLSTTQLTASIPPSDLVNVGTAQVNVFNPPPGGGTSGPLTFTINPFNPMPQITNLYPLQVVEKGPGFPLTVDGSGFVNGSVVRLFGSPIITTFVSNTQLSAQISADDISAAGDIPVSVSNPAPGGGNSSEVILGVLPLGGPPVISILNPRFVATGGQGFTLTVNGGNFINGASVRINGSDRATSFVDPNGYQLTAAIPAADIAQPGNLSVMVVNPGGAASGAQNLPVVSSFTSLSAASFTGASVTQNSIVAAFGTNLATDSANAQTLPLPTNLLGTSVRVRDAAGTVVPAPLFFVGPQQINYFLPAGMAEGVATLTVTLNGNVVAVGQVQVAKLAPGLFAQNANGKGVAAAVALRDLGGGVQTTEPISQFNGTENVPLPVDLGQPGQVFLILFGTGFPGRNGPAGVSVKIGGVDVPVTFAGSTPGLVGLNQINVGPLPATLIGRGLVDIEVTIDGIVANTVQVAIK